MLKSEDHTRGSSKTAADERQQQSNIIPSQSSAAAAAASAAVTHRSLLNIFYTLTRARALALATTAHLSRA